MPAVTRSCGISDFDSSLHDAERAARTAQKWVFSGSMVVTANAGYASRSDRLELTELTAEGAVHPGRRGRVRSTT